MCVFFVRVPGGPGGVVFVKDILMRCFEINVIEPDQDVFNVVSILMRSFLLPFTPVGVDRSCAPCMLLKGSGQVKHQMAEH